MRKITRALVSVSDKTGIAEFCAALVEMGVEILSTGGTARLLKGKGLPVKDVSEHTGFPEMLDGRVKTLHPLIHGGILFMRSNEEHVRQVRESGIAPIDMVVCNLYPFERTVAKPDVTLAEAIENIDIGGPSMVRAAAKNHADVAVVVSPSQYERVLAEMRANDGALGPQTRFELAVAAFRHTARYDAAISEYLSAVGLDGPPPLLWLELERTESLAGGFESGRPAALYSGPRGVRGGLAESSFAGGPEPDAAELAALGAAFGACEPAGPDAVSLVSGGVLVWLRAGRDLSEAIAEAGKAGASRPLFLGLGRALDEEAARAARESFGELDGIAAPGFEGGAVELLRRDERWGKGLKLLEARPLEKAPERRFTPVEGGFVVEEAPAAEESYAVLSKREPDDRDWFEAVLARGLLRFYPPCACVLVREGELVGFSGFEPGTLQAAGSAVKRASQRSRGAFAAFRGPVDAEILPRLFSAGVRGVVCDASGSADERAAALANRYKAVFIAVSSETDDTGDAR